MKVAFAWDQAISVKSFYVKNNVAYTYENDEPYIFHHAIDSTCFMAGYNYAWVGEGGSFLNLHEWENKSLPEENFDIILYSNERGGLDDDKYHLYSPERLRKSYPSAKIIGNIKESYDYPGAPPHRRINRINFYKECDAISAHGFEKKIKEFEWYKVIENETQMKFNWLTIPFNIDYYYDNFYSNEKDLCIYAYLPNPVQRRGRTYGFAEYIGKKYNIPIKYKPLQPGQKYDYLSQKDFINLWCNSIFHFNLDPLYEQPGNQCTQVAASGCINIGGHNDSHFALFPETATNDESVLEEKISEYINDSDKMVYVLENAWKNLNDIYSFDATEKKLNKFIDSLD